MTGTAVVLELLIRSGNLDPSAFYDLPEGLQCLWVEHMHNVIAGGYTSAKG